MKIIQILFPVFLLVCFKRMVICGTDSGGFHHSNVVDGPRVKRLSMQAFDPLTRRSPEKNYIRYGRSSQHVNKESCVGTSCKAVNKRGLPKQDGNLDYYENLYEITANNISDDGFVDDGMDYDWTGMKNAKYSHKWNKKNNFIRFGRNPRSGQDDVDDADGSYFRNLRRHDSFMRLGRGEDNIVRSGRGHDNFIRLGRSQIYDGLDADDYSKRKVTNLIRFGRGGSWIDQYERQGRRHDNFMRLGRTPDNFERAGRRHDNFMRLGRSPDNFERADRRHDNFMRLGRTPDNFERAGRRHDNFMRLGRTPDNFERAGRRHDNFMRLGRTPDNFEREDRRHDNFMRLGRTLDNFDRPNRRHENFMRLGRTLNEESERNKRGYDDLTKFGQQFESMDEDNGPPKTIHENDSRNITGEIYPKEYFNKDQEALMEEVDYETLSMGNEKESDGTPISNTS